MEISFESPGYLHWGQLTGAETREGERTLNIVRKVKVRLHQDHPLAVLAGKLPSTFVSKEHTLVVKAVANHVVNIGGQLAILNKKFDTHFLKHYFCFRVLQMAKWYFTFLMSAMYL